VGAGAEEEAAAVGFMGKYNLDAADFEMFQAFSYVQGKNT